MIQKLLTTTFLFAFLYGTAQEAPENDHELKYRRSSLYTVMLETPSLPYADDIKQYFEDSAIPDKFNDHNLGKRVYDVGELPISEGQAYTPSAVQQALLNQIARDMVAKWFERSEKGGFNMNTIGKRGSYDASAMSITTAKSSKRGLDMLADAGEELIGKTFVLVNEFKYVDKAEVAQKAQGWLSVAGMIGDYAGVSNASTITTLAGAGAAVAGKGYVVKTQGHLYQLIWDEPTANAFYEQLWADDQTITPEKKKAFDESTLFQLKYIGTDNSWADVQSSIFTNKSEVELVQRATMKAMDAVIVKLQKAHDQFKTKVPLFTGEPITAKIGLKEDLTSKSTFEILEQRIDENGRTHYATVGSVRVDDRYPIWDNRFGADEENPNLTVDRTYFKKLSGGTFYPGMLMVQKGGKNFNASRKDKNRQSQTLAPTKQAALAEKNRPQEAFSNSDEERVRSWGFKFGINSSNFGEDWAGLDENRAGYFMGISKNIPLGNYVHLQTELIYSEEGSDTAHMDYIALPMLFKFFFTQNQGFNIQAGPILAVNISTKDADIEKVVGGAFDMRLGAGLGYEWDWGYFDLRYNWGLLDINQSYTETQIFDIVSTESISFGFGIKL